MDLWKIALVGVVVVGLVLFFFPGPEEIPGLEGGALVEEGTYVLERAGQRVGEEAFTLWRVADGYRIDSTVRLGRSTVTASLVLDSAWNPLYYAERGKQAITFRFVNGVPTLRVGWGLVVRSTRFAILPPLAFLGAEAVGPWFAVYRSLQSRLRPNELTAILAGERTTASLVGSPPEEVGLLVLGRMFPAERYRVRVGDREFWLYGQGDLLLAMATADGEPIVHLKEMLPDGLRLAP